MTKRKLRIASFILMMFGAISSVGVYISYEEYRWCFWLAGFLVFSIVVLKISKHLSRPKKVSQRKITAKVTKVAKKYLEGKYEFPFEQEKVIPGSQRRLDLYGRKDGLIVVGEVKTSLTDAYKVSSQLLTYHKLMRNLPHKRIDWVVVLSEDIIKDVVRSGDGLIDGIRQLKVGGNPVDVLVVNYNSGKVWE